MLFLLNDTIIEIDAPEIHLLKRSAAFGGRDVHGLRAREALDLAREKFAQSLGKTSGPQHDILADIAALIISKTGANAALFPVSGHSVAEPRVAALPEPVLEALQSRLAAGAEPGIAAIWQRAA
jgi:hypothetical protein